MARVWRMGDKSARDVQAFFCEFPATDAPIWIESTFAVGGSILTRFFTMKPACLTIALSVLFAGTMPTRALGDTNNRTILLATVPDSSPAMHTDGQQLLIDRPGYRAELLQQAAKQCKAKVVFTLAPWQRALYMVEHGDADGAFASSYSAERTVYGVYPMKDGVPDTTKAVKGYSYSLFVHSGSALTWDGKTVRGQEKQVVVERGGVGAEVARAVGLEPVEIGTTDKLVRMVAEKRVAGLVGISSNIRAELKGNPELAGRIKELTPPLEAKFGYVMFSKSFYAERKELVECFWNAIGKLRTTLAYKEMVKSYTGGQPGE